MNYVKSVGLSVALSSLLMVALVLLLANREGKTVVKTFFVTIELGAPPEVKDADAAEGSGNEKTPPVTQQVGIVAKGSGGLFAPDLGLTIDIQKNLIELGSRKVYRDTIGCPDGTIAVSGAWSVSSQIRVLASYMTANVKDGKTGWFFRAVNADPERIGSGTFIVNCARFS